MECFASFSVSVELGEFGFPEKFQKVCSRLFDPSLRYHAACPVFLHVASLLPLGDNILPLPGCFVKLRYLSLMSLSPSLAGRVILAVGLMIGFYILAVAIAGALLYIPYAAWSHAGRLHEPG